MLEAATEFEQAHARLLSARRSQSASSINPGHNVVRICDMSCDIGFVSDTVVAPGSSRSDKRRINEAVRDRFLIAEIREQPLHVRARRHVERQPAQFESRQSASASECGRNHARDTLPR